MSDKATEIAKDLVGQLTADMFYRLGEHVITEAEAKRHGQKVADAIRAAVKAAEDAAWDAALAEARREIERLQNHLDGIDAVLGGNTIAAINGEVRGQEWRLRKIDELKAVVEPPPTTVRGSEG